ncbi:hypothetical protein M404DRAFT_36666 [Pisolithus tinctorius Marx 270]|uniref:Uncharacterized protein n=1 Tax=Pisolithus tinctorius Marx 270 TaxID=870435 RepID=A0A0C3I6P3_PISTI|nr:hypothetical protein M404DRAFT_36666 [Pisolithus tinctorius Marx 270]
MLKETRYEQTYRPDVVTAQCVSITATTTIFYSTSTSTSTASMWTCPGDVGHGGSDARQSSRQEGRIDEHEIYSRCHTRLDEEQFVSKSGLFGASSVAVDGFATSCDTRSLTHSPDPHTIVWVTELWGRTSAMPSRTFTTINVATPSTNGKIALYKAL